MNELQTPWGEIGYITYKRTYARNTKNGTEEFPETVEREIYGIEKHGKFLDITTNNQAELLGAIYSIEWFIGNFTANDYLKIIIDSKYCINGFNKWLDKWQSNDWMTRDWHTKKLRKVKNSKLWKKMYSLKYQSNIVLEWTKGHDGNKFNEMADELARSVWQKKVKEYINE